jgi:hypothetical protein
MDPMKGAMRIARMPVHPVKASTPKSGSPFKPIGRFAAGGESGPMTGQSTLSAPLAQAAPMSAQSDLANLIHVGPIESHVKGRTDHIPISVAPGSYVMPADVVSGMGQGNTRAGHLALRKRFNLTSGAPAFARGGGIPILAAGGENVISPRDCTRIGGGKIEEGHKRLDKFVVDERKKIVETMKKLPGPKKD